MRSSSTPARCGVAAGAFLETTVLPVPFELILVPLMLARPRLI